VGPTHWLVVERVFHRRHQRVYAAPDWVYAGAFPFPFIANTAGWMTAELGRQPRLIYGVMRTNTGYSQLVHSGQTVFTIMGYAGIFAASTLEWVPCTFCRAQ